MPSRAKRVNSWEEPLANVAKAKKFTERFGLRHSHPSDYLDPLPAQESKDWEDLINRIE